MSLAFQQFDTFLFGLDIALCAQNLDVGALDGQYGISDDALALIARRIG